MATWDVRNAMASDESASLYYQPPTLKQPDLGLESPGDVDAGDKASSLMLNVASLEKARPAHPGELCHFLQRNVDHLVVKSNWDMSWTCL